MSNALSPLATITAQFNCTATAQFVSFGYTVQDQ